MPTPAHSYVWISTTKLMHAARPPKIGCGPKDTYMNRSLRTSLLSILVLLAMAAAIPVAAAPPEETVDLDMVTRIREEGFRHSQVMEIMSELTDRIGPRLTGSPNIKKANEWTRDEMARWGLENAHLEPWGPFGRGWSNELTVVRMTSPDTAMLIAYPEAWTPGTDGVLRGQAVKVKLASKEDLEANRGKLAGKIVLIDDLREVKPHEEAELERYTAEKLAELGRYEIPGERPRVRGDFSPEEFRRRQAFRRELNKFLAEEKVAVALRAGRGDGGTVFVQGSGSYKRDEPPVVPSLQLAVEHYGRIARLLDRKVPVELEINVVNKFYDADTQWNTIAEIPGTDKKDEIVMLGAHLDSWHTGTGATDNGAGSAVMMEAMRILKALNVKPRRTIRIALWTGEEQGLLGSRAYVREHFGSRPQPPAGETDDFFSRREPRGPLTLKPEHAKLAAYFNVDNGTGRIRGIYLQENAAARPIFHTWFEPFADLGATTCSMRNTGGTDHLSFDAVGLPGFQFIQDPVEYSTRTHHSNMDVFERIQRDDMMQNAVIVATFAYQAAMRDQMIPRKPIAGEVIQAQAPAPPAKPAGKKAGKKS